jgi:AhpD family alkylhydroperoxidase
MPKPPKAFLEFGAQQPKVIEAYERLGGACAAAGPLDGRLRELVKLGMAIGGRLEGAVRSHARRALEAGATPEEIRHVVALAVPTVGLPTAVAAFTWVEGLVPRPRRTARAAGRRRR